MLSGTVKPLVWLSGEVKTPPFSALARREAGYLLRMLQVGEKLAMPASKDCHELRVTDENKVWRIVLRIDRDAIVILDVFAKKTNSTPARVKDNCRRRLKKYEAGL